MVLQRTTLFFIFAAILCLAGFGGCGKETPKEAKDQTALEATALQYWTDRLVERNYEAAYGREIDDAGGLPFEKYRELVSRNENFSFTGLAIVEAVVEDNDGLVQVDLKCRVPQLGQPIARTIKDQWVYQSGHWKHRFSETQP